MAPNHARSPPGAADQTATWTPNLVLDHEHRKRVHELYGDPRLLDRPAEVARLALEWFGRA